MPALLNLHLVVTILIYILTESWGDDDACLNRCEVMRPKGSRESFQFDCNIIYKKPEEQKFCSDDCKSCDLSICNPAKPNIFNCPPEASIDVDIGERCESRCDSGRQPGKMKRYTLKCNKVYKTTYEIATCKHDCRDCPNWVCNDRRDKNTFTCPVRNFDGPCKINYCDSQRKKAGRESSTEVFSFKCTDLPDESEKEDCRAACSSCPKNVCNPDVDANVFQCPSLVPSPISDELPHATGKRTFEGLCETRCNNHRKGGKDPYDLDCEAMPDHAEKDKCRTDCIECPDDICAGESNFIIHCPATSRNDPLLPPWVIVLIIILLLLIMIGIILLYNYCKKNRKSSTVTPSSVEDGESANQKNTCCLQCRKNGAKSADKPPPSTENDELPERKKAFCLCCVCRKNKQSDEHEPDIKSAGKTPPPTKTVERPKQMKPFCLNCRKNKQSSGTEPDTTTVEKSLSSTENPAAPNEKVASTEKPKESMEKPKESIEKPMESTEKPKESTEEPRESTEKPKESAEKPRESTKKSRHSTEKPTASAENPAEPPERSPWEKGYPTTPANLRKKSK